MSRQSNDALDVPRLRRGLIIGDVQSGKTATYTGLVCKAVDAGYKVVILLTGITENLRRQTQERIDEGIVGITMKKEGKVEKYPRVGVGLDNKQIRATSVTSTLNDFVGNCNKITMSLASNSLVLFVIKKKRFGTSETFQLAQRTKYRSRKRICGCTNASY